MPEQDVRNQRCLAHATACARECTTQHCLRLVYHQAYCYDTQWARRHLNIDVLLCVSCLCPFRALYEDIVLQQSAAGDTAQSTTLELTHGSHGSTAAHSLLRSPGSVGAATLCGSSLTTGGCTLRNPRLTTCQSTSSFLSTVEFFSTPFRGKNYYSKPTFLISPTFCPLSFSLANIVITIIITNVLSQQLFLLVCRGDGGKCAFY